MPDFVAREYLGPNFDLRRKNGPPADFWIGYTRNNCHGKHGKAPELTRVERQDTLLVLIRDLRHEDGNREAKSAASRRKTKKTKKKKTKPKTKPRTQDAARRGQGTIQLGTNQPKKSKPKPKSKPKSKPSGESRGSR